MKSNRVVLALLNLSPLAETTSCPPVKNVNCGPYLPVQYYEIQTQHVTTPTVGTQYHCWTETDKTTGVDMYFVMASMKQEYEHVNPTPDPNLWLLDDKNCTR